MTVEAIITADAISDIVHSRDNELLNALANGFESGVVKYYSLEADTIFENDDLVAAWMNDYRATARVNRNRKYVEHAAFIGDQFAEQGHSVDDIPDVDIEIAAVAYEKEAMLVFAADAHHSISRNDICKAISVPTAHFTEFFAQDAEG